MSIIINYEDIPWIENISEESRYSELIKIISLGRNIIEFTQVSINPDCSIFQPLCKKIEAIESDTRNVRLLEEQKMETTRLLMNKELSTVTSQISNIHDSIKADRSIHLTNLQKVQDSINVFTNASNKSSVKGSISENIIEDIIKNFFKEDTIINTSKESKKGDYQLTTTDGNSILIEVKNYKSVVDQKEVDKFIRDVQYNKMPGIFISTTSRIVKKRLLEIEELPSGEFTIYISDTGIAGESIILSVLLMKELLNKKSKLGNIANSLDTELILFNIEKFSDVCKIVCNMTNTINKIKSNINENLQELHNESYKCEYEIKTLFKKIKYEIVNELSKIDSTIEIITKDERDAILEEYQIKNNNLVSLIEMLFSVQDKLECNLSTTNDKWIFVNKNNEKICDIKRYKTKIEIKFVHKKTHCIQLELNNFNRELIESEIIKSI